jgi:hypothetical protein
LAAQHFAMDTQEATDYVIHTCTTLGSIIEFLNTSSLRGNKPWSIVNVVAHGNPQTGLNLYITEGGHKATPKRLVQAVLLDTTPDFEQGIVDSMSRINFWSCGIGKSPLVNASLKQIFSTADHNSPQVYCSPHFVIFHPSKVSNVPRRLKASYWPYYFKRGYRPGDTEITTALHNEYPEERIDWDEALRHRCSNDTASLYHGEYHIPVSYTRIYQTREERPALDTPEQQMQWVNAQPEIQDQLDEAGIPMDKYHWTVNKIIYTQEDGTKVPAIKAIGMATVLYVLKEEI